MQPAFFGSNCYLSVSQERRPTIIIGAKWKDGVFHIAGDFTRISVSYNYRLMVNWLVALCVVSSRNSQPTAV